MSQPVGEKQPSVDIVSVETAPIQADVEKLGRARPAIFPSALSEVAFCFSVMQSALMSVRV